MRRAGDAIQSDEWGMSALPTPPGDDSARLRIATTEGCDDLHAPKDSSCVEQPLEQPHEHPGVRHAMSDAHLHQIALCAKRAKPIEKAVRFASFSGWSTLLAGALTIPFAIGKLSLLIFAITLAAIGTRELTLRRSLKVLDVKATRKLAINQLVLGGALISYAVYMLLSVPSAGMISTALQSDPMMQSTPELSGMFDDLAQLEQTAMALMYVAMIFLAFVLQGGTSLYYLLKGSKLKKLHKETPHWVVQVYQRVHQ